MAAGDITTVLVSRVRTLLDEASAGFFTATEIYYALTDAQVEVINIVLSTYKAKIKADPNEELPEVLRNCIASTTGTGTTSLPSGFLHALSIYVTATKLPVFIRPDGRGRAEGMHNTYLASSATQPYCSLSASQIVFETSVAWTLEYLQLPANDIDATHDPTLSKIAYNALIQYATAFLLKKDESPRANDHLQYFLKEVLDLS